MYIILRQSSIRDKSTIEILSIDSHLLGLSFTELIRIDSLRLLVRILGSIHSESTESQIDGVVSSASVLQWGLVVLLPCNKKNLQPKF